MSARKASGLFMLLLSEILLQISHAMVRQGRNPQVLSYHFLVYWGKQHPDKTSNDSTSCPVVLLFRSLIYFVLGLHMAFIYGQCTRAPKSPTAYLINRFLILQFQVLPVPPLPSSYAPMLPISVNLTDADSFRRDLPPLPNHPRAQLGSQSSWLTSSNRSHTTITSWSYPTTHYEDTIPTASTPDLQTALATAIMHPTIPALADAQVLRHRRLYRYLSFFQ
ncbi:hypothetical protein BYT27DRAFT_7249291 [Phlegmacium glaucopus]|nr:hypothetical protein BYT27DRAFT_7249291 [Phlegmacium glaucopus]